LQDVVLRVDRAFQAFFRRIQAGETPGYPAFTAATVTPVSSTRSSAMEPPSITDTSSSRRSAGLRSAGPGRLGAHPRRSRAVGKSTAGMSVSPVRMCPYGPCLRLARKRA
jgi:hypothetical protein